MTVVNYYYYYQYGFHIAIFQVVISANLKDISTANMHVVGLSKQ